MEKMLQPQHLRLKKDILLQRCKVGRMQILFGFI